MLVIVAFLGFIMKITDLIQFFKKKGQIWIPSLRFFKSNCDSLCNCDIPKVEVKVHVNVGNATPQNALSLLINGFMKGNKSFSTTPQQHGDKAKGDKRSHVLECIKSIPHKKKKVGVGVTVTWNKSNSSPSLGYFIILTLCLSPATVIARGVRALIGNFK